MKKIMAVAFCGPLLAFSVPAPSHAGTNTPGCVTQGEYYRAKIGMKMSRVHAIWDTKGHVRVHQGIAQNRGYQICGSKGTNVYAEFAKRNGVWRLTWKLANAG